jgi:hypothetical protein
MKHTKTFFLLLTVMTLLSISTPAFAGTGSIRIDPPLPDMTASPAEFEIWAQSGVANDPHIFLVITQECWAGLSADTTVDWGGSPIIIETGDWNGPESTNGDKLPPGTTPGAGYTVASLKDHLDTDGPIYWVFYPILGGAQLTSVHETITVSLSSDDPEMLVYILGKSPDSDDFDTRVPPTIPGFVVPEIPLGTIMGLASMIAALAIYARKASLAVIKY